LISPSFLTMFAFHRVPMKRQTNPLYVKQIVNRIPMGDRWAMFSSEPFTQVFGESDGVR